MKKVYFTEINTTIEQMDMIQRAIGVCRYVYNLYLTKNKEYYDKDGTVIDGHTFYTWLYRDYINEETEWIRDISSQSVKKAIMNAHYHLKKFLKGLMDFPMYKTKKGQDMKVYFIQEDGDFQVERHRICIPDIGWIRLKEFGYLPLECVKNCAISYKAGKYFISVL